MDDPQLPYLSKVPPLPNDALQLLEQDELTPSQERVLDRLIADRKRRIREAREAYMDTHGPIEPEVPFVDWEPVRRERPQDAF